MAALYSQLPLPNYGGSALPTSGGTRVQVECPPSARRQTTSHLPMRTRSAADTPRQGTSSLAGHRDGETPSGLSSGLSVFGTTRNTPTSRGLPCPPLAPLPRNSYSPPAPRLPRLNHPADTPGTGYHSGRESPSQVRTESRIAAHVARGSPLSRPPYVPGFRPGIVSVASRHDFEGPNTEAPFYPSTAALRGSASRLRRRSPASPSGPLVVELFAVGCCRPIPGSGPRPGPACHQAEGSPRRHG